MLTWTDDLALGNDDIDRDHRSAVEAMSQLAVAADADVPALFGAFAAHMREHFERENALMRATGFPARACHEGEHERVLGLLDELAAEIAAGGLETARHFARRAGPAWFIDHRNSMDFVTVDYARRQPR
jgi:hemerythrin